MRFYLGALAIGLALIILSPVDVGAGIGYGLIITATILFIGTATIVRGRGLR